MLAWVSLLSQLYQDTFNGKPFPQIPQNEESGLSQVLTHEVYDKLKLKHDSTGYTFYQLINYDLSQNALKSNSIQQIQAGSHASYDVFSLFLDKVVEKLHGFSAQHHQKCGWGDIQGLQMQDLNQKHGEEFILGFNVSLVRNVKEYPFPAGMPYWKRRQFESYIKRILQDNLQDGRYYNLQELNSNQRNLAFKQNNLQYADHGRFNTGRGIFVNNEQNLVIWVNENDQLTFRSLEKGGNLKNCVQRLLNCLNRLENVLHFATDQRLGVLTQNPINLGTGLRLQAIVRIPWETQDLELFKKNLHKVGLEGQKHGNDEGVYIIWNTKTLGLSEEELLHQFYEAINQVIQNEKFARSSRYD